MQKEELLAIPIFCTYHNIEVSFIYSLRDSGLIEIIIQEQNEFIHLDQLPHLEKIIRLHNEMEINVPGIETVLHLLDQIESMKKEIVRLHDRLNIYEPAV